MKKNITSPRVSGTHTIVKGENVRRTLTMKKCSKCEVCKNKHEFYKKASQCKECQLADKKLYYARNSELLRKKRQAYYSNNRSKVRTSESKYRKSRRKIDVQFKLLANIRNHIGQFLQTEKKGKSIDYLGCSLQELKQYLESKFLPGMTWENYGIYGWHIDHIFPLSKVDLTDKDAVPKVLHYTNLQPLWAADNIKKGNTVS